MVIVVKIDNSVLDICKSYGIKNYSKLTIKRITDKNGHSRFVWVKNEVDIKYKSNVFKNIFYNLTNNGTKSAEIGFNFIREKVQDEKIKELFSNFNHIGANFDNFRATTGTPLFHPPENGRKSYIKLHSIKDMNDKENIMTFIHECTHYFDYYCNDYPFNFSSLFNDDFMKKYKIDELPTEFNEYKTRVQIRINELDNEINDIPQDISQVEFLEKMVKIKNELEIVKSEFEVISNSDFEDFFNCLSIGKILSNSNHSPKYFSKVNPINECLAIYISFKAVYPKAVEMINKIKPGVTEYLDYILNNMITKIKEWGLK